MAFTFRRLTLGLLLSAGALLFWQTSGDAASVPETHPSARETAPVRPGFLASKEIIVAPVGEAARVDTQLAKNAIRILSQGTNSEQEEMIREIKARPDQYAPAVFYAMSRTLFEQGQQDEAAFWFYAGQLRARYDANRCTDVSARAAVDVLNQEYGPVINTYMFRNLATLKALIPKVVQWDEATPHHYDQRWINLHGMEVMMGGLGDTSRPPKNMSFPESEWPGIAAKTRKQYLDGFHQAMKLAEKAQQKNP